MAHGAVDSGAFRTCLRMYQAAAVVAHWTVAFLGRGRAERAITEQQVFGRQALGASAEGRRGR